MARYSSHNKKRDLLIVFFCIVAIILINMATPVHGNEEMMVSEEEAPPQTCDTADGSGTCENNMSNDEGNTDDDDDDFDISSFLPLGEPTEFAQSTKDDIRLAVRRWEPPEGIEVKAAIVVHHGGVGWHSGYFDVLGQGLKDRGIVTVAYDMIGSGYSDSLPVGRQYFESMDVVADDLTKMIQETKEKYGNKPVFGFGESFGGMIVLHHALKDPVADGYILSGPVIRLKKEMLPPPFVIAILRFVSRFFPLLSLPVVDVASTFDDAFGDKRWAVGSRTDPFIQEAFTVPPRLRSVISVIDASNVIWSSKERMDFPFVIFIGENDTRVEGAESQAVYDTAKSQDKTLKVIPGGYHQLYQDQPEVTQSVINGVAEWVLARC